ncbi:ABC transporter permease subunit [Desnuesiella massiliensis]|uniref:ABC transporter permease subunit n=1 Tax=Desnuesiella massiliensis TaxID=1650662 RepID=UPI0006E23FBA|nr:ABC transporter permease subunit [Desnuesiella massiliensis]
MNRIQKALMKKDIKEITSSKQIMIPMIIVPLLMMVIIPATLLIIAKFAPKGINAINGLSMILDRLPESYKALSEEQLIITAAMEFLFPGFFLIIPIMMSSILGSSAVVGEKEHKTMETLLYTPVTMEQLARAKILGVFIPSYVVTLVAFVLFGIVMNLGGLWIFHSLIFPNVKWLILIFWLSPALCIFALTFTILISAKSKTFQEAQQLSGVLVLPVILLLVGQMTGLFLLNDIIIFIIGAVLFLSDYFLIKRVSKNFTAEKLI